MEADAHDLGGLATGTKLGHELIVDLALSAESAIMWSFDFAAGNITWMPGLDAVLGMPGAPAEEVQTRLGELLAPLTVAARSAPVWEDFELEQPFATPAGETKWVRFRARTFGGTRPGGLLGIATDVTDRHQDRQAIADLADRYRLLVDLSPEGICVHENGLLVYANPATVRLLGAECPGDILDRPIVELVDLRSVPGMRKRIQALTTPGARSEPSELLLRRLDGSTIMVETVSVRTTWKGRPAYQVILRDVTDRKAAEAALRYQAALVSHVSDAIIATDSQAVVTSWNPAAESVYGRSAAEAIGRPVSELVGAPLEPGAVLLAGGVVQDTHRAADESALSIRVSAAEMNGGYVLVCADETARRRAEQDFSTVVASLDEGVVVVGASGLVESANPAARRILGMREEDLLGMPPTALRLYDESGTPVPLDEYPTTQTRLTGEPQNGRVVRVRRPDGRSVWLSLTCRSLSPDGELPAPVVNSFTDITERRAIRERLEHEATHDPLTGLANRTLVIERLSAAQENPGQPGLTAVLFIDLDKFKVINDSLGHSVGDKVLRIAGERLRHGARRGGLVGRLGGDEFVVVTHGVTDHGEIRLLTERLRDSLTEPITVDGRQLHVDASIGIVLAGPGDRRSPEDLLRDADVAMYQAKTLGRGRYEFFDVELRERMQRRLRLEQDLRDAVQNGQLWVAYQPVVDLQTRHMVAVEGLLRWDHPVHGAISPTEFIPLAEESDLINLIGMHMLWETTRELAIRRVRHGLDTHLKVNLSTRQLDDPQLVPAVAEALRTTGLPPHTLCLEITESALMRDSAAATGALSELRGLGVRLAIDDFGTGYSSLAQLQRLTLDTLKIDRSFVTDLGESADAEAIVTSIIAMAHAVDLTVVAEGVEKPRQLEILRGLGCDQAQGFYLGRPAPAGQLFPRASTATTWPVEPDPTL
ncbi:sensor domain-containing protein [Amycolatopsis anabasis]|uniref:sensor domain-containing protein n=1 Tax=Amycolatopsis anabasis TaxID=1840409 RepID=UPI00131E77E7|nr:EAL domain-containing protein [Amycolatopsis anabasis]